MALALTALRLRLADLVRNHDNRDSQGRFTPTGRDNLTHQPLTHEQHAAAIAALDKTKGRGTGICGHCTKLLNGPRKGQHLGVVPIIKGAHYNDALCPSHMHQTLHTFYRNRGMSDTQAHQRAEAQVRAGWSAEDLATLDYTPTPTPETTSIRLRMGDLLRRRRGGKRPRNKGHHTTKRRPHKAKVQSLKAHLAQLKTTVPAPKLPDVTIIHGAQGKIINNIGSGMTRRLADAGLGHLQERLMVLRQVNLTRYGGLNGRLPLFAIGLDGKKHFAGSTAGGGKLVIPGVTHFSHHQPGMAAGGIAHPSGSTHHWEGAATTYSGKKLSGAVDVHSGKAYVTAIDEAGKTDHYTIETDPEYGGYKATHYVKGVATTLKHGLTLGAASHFIKNSIAGGYPAKSANGTKLLPGANVFTTAMIPPGPKPSKAQQAINDANNTQASAKGSFDQYAHGGVASIMVEHGTAVEHHHADGSLDKVTYDLASKTFTVQHYPADPNSPTTPEQSFTHHLYWGQGGPTYFQQSHVETPSVTKTYKTANGVKKYLVTQGVTEDLSTKLKKEVEDQAASKKKWQEQAAALQAHHAAVEGQYAASHAASSHSTTGWANQYSANLQSGTALAEAMPSSTGVATYDLTTGKAKVAIVGKSDGTVTLTYKASGAKTETHKGLTAEAAKEFLTAHTINAESALFVDIAIHDATRYSGAPQPEQQARIAAVTARRVALDARFGEYSPQNARARVKQIYHDYPALRAALTMHLTGGAHLSATSVAAAAKAQSVEQAKAGLLALREVSEWSLLHQPTVTREGTMRLFHGTNGKSAPAVWDQRLQSAEERRGTPMTSHWSVARQFADTGKAGRFIISAHVPVDAIAVWQGIRADTLYPHEYEYTLGTGAITDYTIINMKTL